MMFPQGRVLEKLDLGTDNLIANREKFDHLHPRLIRQNLLCVLQPFPFEGDFYFRAPLPASRRDVCQMRSDPKRAKRQETEQDRQKEKEMPPYSRTGRRFGSA